MVKSYLRLGCRFILAACAMSGAIAIGANRTWAQVTGDGTLNTLVNNQGNNFVITGGQPAGNNLFHSFSNFSVLAGQTALFNNPTSIVNIFGRVTGSTPSNIDGTIQANTPANLFLMNPSGIIFGPNARLDIGGSFVGTTANGIRFPGGGEFSMNSFVDSGNNLLAVNPSALFFTQTPLGVGVSVNQSTLQVQPGKNLFLVGGEVKLENGGTVRAPGGRIELGGLTGAGEVKIEEITTGSNPNLNFPDVGLTFPEGVARADVIFNSGAIADVTGENGGDIAINARNLDVSGQSNICAGLGSNIDCGGVDGQPGGTSASKAGNIVIDATGEVRLSQLSRIANNVNPNATGNTDADIFQTVKQAIDTGDSSVIFGSIFITANSLSVTDGASVSTSTFGQGNAGLLYVEAKDSVSVSGYQPIPGVSDPLDPSTFSRSRLASAVGEGSTGSAGGIFIQTGSFSLTNYSLINSSTSGNGDAGAVIVEADGEVSFANDSVVFNNVEMGGNGDSGVIDITAESLSLTNGSQLQTLARDVNQGNAGSVTINVRDAVTISGLGNPFFGNQGNPLPSAIFSTVNPGVNGNAGNIEISARSIIVNDQGQINTDLYGTGTPGIISLEATDSISLTNEATIRSTIGKDAVATSGYKNDTGILLIGESIFLKDGATVNVDNRGMGAAGNIIILARDLILNNQAKITAISASGTGGAIVTARDLILPDNQGTDTDGTILLVPGDFVLLLRNSEISTLAGSADRPGGINGGDITISTRYLITAPARSNDLDAQAFGGKGGRIEITADRLYDILERPLSDLSNDISASSGVGPPGVVTSNVLNADPTQGLANLPTDPVDPSRLISEACAPRGGIAERQKNQFIVTGRGGLPPDPNAAFPGEAEVNELKTPNPEEENTTGEPSSHHPTTPYPITTTSPQKSAIVEAQGWVYGENGDIIFTAQAPNVTPNTPVLTPASTCNVSSTSSQ